MRADDRATFYADGSNVANVKNRNTRNIIPRTTRVVAVQAYNGGARAFILAGFSNGFKTDTVKWNCTDQLYTGRKTADYDDSHWSPAVDSGHFFDVDFVTDERAIWTEEVHDNSYVYWMPRIYYW